MVAGELCEGSTGPSDDFLDLVGEPCGVAVGDEAERLGVLLGDWDGDAGGDHGPLVLFEGAGLEGDGPAEHVGEDVRDIGVGQRSGSGQPVGLSGMRDWGLGDLGGDGGDVACVDQTDAATGRRQEPNVLILTIAGASARKFCM